MNFSSFSELEINKVIETAKTSYENNQRRDSRNQVLMSQATWAGMPWKLFLCKCEYFNDQDKDIIDREIGVSKDVDDSVLEMMYQDFLKRKKLKPKIIFTNDVISSRIDEANKILIELKEQIETIDAEIKIQETQASIPINRKCKKSHSYENALVDKILISTKNDNQQSLNGTVKSLQPFCLDGVFSDEKWFDEGLDVVMPELFEDSILILDDKEIL